MRQIHSTETLAKAVLDAGSYRAAAKALGMAQSSVRERLAGIAGSVQGKGSEDPFASLRCWAAERGLLGFDPVLPGYAIKRTTTRYDKNGDVAGEYVTQAKAPGARSEIPAGHVVKGVSILRDGEGRTVQEWVKTREGHDPLDVAEAIKAAFEGWEGHHIPQPAPEVASQELLTLLPLADWHVGMFSWHRETGTNWDTDIAEAVLGRHVEEAIQRSPASAHGVVLGGGDLMHADNQENRTARSGNQLDVDGRYPRVLKVACRLMVRTVDAMLRRHARVTVRILPGNHDEHASVAVSYFLMAWYRDEHRVTVDVGPGLFWWHRHGRVMLGATHGHTVKAKDMPAVMAHRRAADWGETDHRYVHTFHLHHTAKFATEGMGCIAEVHQAPIPQDAWHYGAGFLSGRSIQTITYHRAFGEVSRARVAILDAHPEGTA